MIPYRKYVNMYLSKNILWGNYHKAAPAARWLPAMFVNNITLSLFDYLRCKDTIHFTESFEFSEIFTSACIRQRACTNHTSVSKLTKYMYWRRALSIVVIWCMHVHVCCIGVFFLFLINWHLAAKRMLPLYNVDINTNINYFDSAF